MAHTILWRSKKPEKAADLLRTPLVQQAIFDPVDDTGQAFGHLECLAPTLVTQLVCSSRIVSLTGMTIAPELSADGAVVSLNPLTDLTQTQTGFSVCKNLVSLFLGQLLVCHLCFTLVGKVRRVPALALLPLPCDAVLQLFYESKT